MAAPSKMNQDKKCISLNRGQTRPFQGGVFKLMANGRGLGDGSPVPIWMKSFSGRDT